MVAARLRAYRFRARVYGRNGDADEIITVASRRQRLSCLQEQRSQTARACCEGKSHRTSDRLNSPNGMAVKLS